MASILLPRIPGSAERARAWAALVGFLCRDRQFRTMASKISKRKDDARSRGIAEIRDILHLPNTEWINIFLSRLVELLASEDPPLVPLVSHSRPVYEFELAVKGVLESFVVDPEGSSSWIRTESLGIDPGDSTEPPSAYRDPDHAPTSCTLHDLERMSNAPRRARRWWADRRLPKRMQPTETIRRDVYLSYLVRWRGLTLDRAASRVADRDAEGRLHGRSERGHKKLRGDRRRYHDQNLTPAAVRKAVRRADRLLAQT